MNVSIQNRNESYFADIEQLKGRRKTVYNLIKQYGALTSQEIREKMVLGVNQVSGRITELQELFLIKGVTSKINNRSERKNTLWTITTKDERTDLINAHFIELRNKRDLFVNDLNVEVSEFAKIMLKKEIKKIDKLIKKLENICI